MFQIQIDCSKCVSITDKSAYLEKTVYDCWRFADFSFESGKIYAIISEYGEGCMHLSYLLGGKVDFGKLQISINGQKTNQKALSQISWNLEPSQKKYRNGTVKKSIEKMLKQGNCKDTFEQIAEKFILTEPRYNRKLFQLSGERWRASAALGYAAGKQIFYAPYKTSTFYYQMSQQGLVKVLRNLTDSGAMVFLPTGSDRFLKHIADECIYLDREYDIDSLKQLYSEMFGEEHWVW